MNEIPKPIFKLAKSCATCNFGSYIGCYCYKHEHSFSNKELFSLKMEMDVLVCDDWKQLESLK
jgi:hypothetical protein